VCYGHSSFDVDVGNPQVSGCEDWSMTNGEGCSMRGKVLIDRVVTRVEDGRAESEASGGAFERRHVVKSYSCGRGRAPHR